MICLSLSSCAAFGDDGRVSGEVAEKFQSEIQHAGYECERVDIVETRWFFGTTANVECDSVFRLILEHERRGVSVEVVNF